MLIVDQKLNVYESEKGDSMYPPCDGGRALVVLRSDRMDGINKCRYLEIMTLFKEYTATDVWRSFTIYAQAADTRYDS